MEEQSKVVDMGKDVEEIQYFVPPDRVKEVSAWCGQMQKKYPLMKAARIARKAAEYFHLKPLSEEQKGSVPRITESKDWNPKKDGQCLIKAL
jgi:hypothetical protein